MATKISPMEKYTIVKAKELKVSDIIIHNYTRFLITECGCGKGAGSLDFGEYFWIKGEFLHADYVSNSIKTFKDKADFWSYQECPIIKCINNSGAF